MIDPEAFAAMMTFSRFVAAAAGAACLLGGAPDAAASSLDRAFLETRADPVLQNEAGGGVGVGDEPDIATAPGVPSVLEDDRIVCIKGRVDKRDDLPKLMAVDIEPFDGITTGASPPLRIRVNPAVLSESLSARLKQLLTEHPGDSEVFLHLGDTTVVKLPDQFAVSSENGLVGELRVLLGPDAIVL